MRVKRISGRMDGPGAADRGGDHRIAQKLHSAIRRIHFFGKEVEATQLAKGWAALGPQIILLDTAPSKNTIIYMLLGIDIMRDLRNYYGEEVCHRMFESIRIFLWFFFFPL